MLNRFLLTDTLIIMCDNYYILVPNELMKNGCVWVFVQEEDTEEEPKLKYERLTNGVTEILQKDAASCMTVHDKVFKSYLACF